MVWIDSGVIPTAPQITTGVTGEFVEKIDLCPSPNKTIIFSDVPRYNFYACTGFVDSTSKLRISGVFLPTDEISLYNCINTRHVSFFNSGTPKQPYIIANLETVHSPLFVIGTGFVTCSVYFVDRVNALYGKTDMQLRSHPQFSVQDTFTWGTNNTSYVEFWRIDFEEVKKRDMIIYASVRMSANVTGSLRIGVSTNNVTWFYLPEYNTSTTAETFVYYVLGDFDIKHIRAEFRSSTTSQGIYVMIRKAYVLERTS